MLRLFGVVVGVLWLHLAMAQQIDYFEYYIDSDPGFEQGTSVSLTAAADLTLDFNVDLNDVTSGMHTLYLRGRDSDGQWTHTANQPFLRLVDDVLPNLTYLEYFIDDDPGLGSGTEVTLTANADITVDFTVDLASLSSGAHMLYVRGRDANGQWTQTYSQSFLRITDDQLADVEYVEYFVDSDPGIGNGTPVAFTAGQDVTIDFNVDLATLSEGYHQLYLRARTTAGQWTQTFQENFYIGLDGVPNITALEYFFDTDPGFGKGNQVTIDVNEPQKAVFFNAAIDGLSEGIHSLFIRTIDSEGSWSQTVKQDFINTKLPNDPTGNLMVFEYFFDTDPGFGNGQQIALNGQGFYEGSVTINLDDTNLTLGTHKFGFRVKDSDHEWSQTSFKNFMKVQTTAGETPSNVTYLEYYLTDEAGSLTTPDFGQGTAVTVTPNADVTSEFNVDLNGLELGNYTLHLRAKNALGQWSQLNSHDFQVCPELSSSIEEAICQGESFVLGTQTLIESGVYSEVFTTDAGCDSTVTLTLTVNPTYQETATASICEGETYTFGTQSLTASGEYTELFQSQTNCDSSMVLTLTVDPVYNETAAVAFCDGESYTFGKQIITTAGDFTEVFQSKDGCDSTVVLTTTVHEVYDRSETVAVCEGTTYAFGTQTLTDTGSYIETFMSQQGCDSTVNLTFVVNPVYYETSAASICAGDSFTFGSQTLTEAGTYTELFQSMAGCDSTVVLTLDIDPVYNETAQVTFCEGETYAFGTQAITTAGEFTEIFQSKDGCDSTVVLTATVNPSYDRSETVTVCDGTSYDFGAQTLTEAGVYTESFMTQAGCDSTVNLTFVVNPVYKETSTASICAGDNFTFGSQTLTEAGSYTELFQSSAGCDSTVVLTLTVNPVFSETAEVTICDGDSFTFGTQNLNTAGEYSEVFQSRMGCDSTVVLTLTVNPAFNESVETSFCEGESYMFGGQTITTSGEFTEVFQSEMGCDSTVVLSVTMLPVFEEDESVSICAGEVFNFNGQSLDASGNYSEIFESADGCDSTVNLTLMVIDFDVNVSENAGTLTVAASGTTYQWIDCANDQPIPGANEASFTPSTLGTYRVVVEKEGCEEVSECVEGGIILSNSIQPSDELMVYPNPTNGMVYVDFGGVMYHTVYELVDLTGKVIQQGMIHDQSEFELKIDGAEGVYLLKLSDESGKFWMYRINKIANQ